MNNMTKRVIVAIIAAPVILYLPFIGINYFAAFIFIISFLASKETLSFYKTKHIRLNGLSPFIVSVIPVVFLTGGFETAAEYSVLSAFVLFTLEIFRGKEKSSYIISAYLLMIVYCGIFPSLLIDVIVMTSPLFFIFIYSVIIATDTFAYFGGLTCSKLFRTHKLLERLSPKKTVEGALFGLIFAVLTGYLIAGYTELGKIISVQNAVILSALISIFGQTGDLFESMIKRDFKIKDSSNIIPGHGGILDRFDSLIFVSPAVYLYIKYFIN
ncbi:MAG: phosphatidate cytidylyltransferase [Candidatus Delongbacteria bacterium]|nr:phosphatidate cytidylyltransferase [Candidatus Delongbacteria bacterium]